MGDRIKIKKAEKETKTKNNLDVTTPPKPGQPQGDTEREKVHKVVQ